MKRSSNKSNVITPRVSRRVWLISSIPSVLNRAVADAAYDSILRRVRAAYDAAHAACVRDNPCPEWVRARTQKHTSSVARAWHVPTWLTLGDPTARSRRADMRGVWQARIHGAPSSTYVRGYATNGAMPASAIKRSLLTPAARDLVRAMRDIVARERNPRVLDESVRVDSSGRKQRVNREPEGHGSKGQAWRGLVVAREARMHERGASGVRGVRGATARVSVRDAHAATQSDEFGHAATKVRAMASVGVATGLDTLGLDPHACLLAARKSPAKATVRVTYADGRTEVRLVSDYQEVRESRRVAKRAARVAALAHESDVVKLATRQPSTIIGACDTL